MSSACFLARIPSTAVNLNWTQFSRIQPTRTLRAARVEVPRLCGMKETHVLSVDETIQLIQIGQATQTSCSSKLSEGPWVWDAEQPAYGPGASMADMLPAGS